jgi:integrase
MGVKVRERGGAWWLFIDHKGQRKAKRVGTGKSGREAAKEAAKKIQARLALGDASIFQPEAASAVTPTFATVAEEWIRRYPALHAVRPGTMGGYTSFVTRHLVPFFGALPITAVTAERIEDFIEAKRGPGGSVRRPGKGLSDPSLRTGLLTLRLILQRAVRTKLITANPMNDVEWRGAPRIDEANVDPFTATELRALLGAAQAIAPDLATMLRVWAQTGLRAGELSELQWQDLDLERGTVLVRRTFSRHRIGPTKTGRERTVSFLHPIADDTPEWRPGAGTAGTAVAGLHGLKVRPLEPEAFVFGQGATPLSSMALHRAWRRVVATAKVRYRSPEQFRHTFASTLLSRNAPLLYVQQQGGWRSASVLLRVYARWMPQDLGASTSPATQPSATQAQPAATAAPALRVVDAR